MLYSIFEDTHYEIKVNVSWCCCDFCRLYYQAARPAPRRPDFLIDSLKREGLYLSPRKEEVPLRVTPIYETNPARNATDAQCVTGLNHKAKDRKASRDVTSGHSDKSLDATGESEPRAPIPPSQLTSTMNSSQQGELLENVSFLPTSDSEQSFSVPVPEPSKRKTKVRPHVGFTESGVQTGASLTELVAPEKLELLPPTAFMVRKDGTPIIELGAGHGGPVSHPKHNGLAQDVDTTQQLGHPINSGITQGVGREPNGLSRPGDHDHDDNVNLHFLSPADEMVHIRARLAEFKKCKQRLK